MPGALATAHRTGTGTSCRHRSPAAHAIQFDTVTELIHSAKSTLRVRFVERRAVVGSCVGFTSQYLTGAMDYLTSPDHGYTYYTTQLGRGVVSAMHGICVD
jgi:hypothetical protein